MKALVPVLPLLATLALATACGGGGPAAGKIAFISNRDSNHEIYIIDADGSGLERLTDNSSVDSSPAWSPDGSRIAFFSNRDGAVDIYVVNVDGSGQTRLTNNPADDFYPVWSPAGRR